MKSSQSRKNRILEKVANDDFLKGVCKNVCKHQHEDLFQEFLLVLSEKKTEFLTDLFKKKNEFKGYCIRTLQVMAQSPRSDFNNNLVFKFEDIEGDLPHRNKVKAGNSRIRDVRKEYLEIIKLIQGNSKNQQKLFQILSAHLNTREDLSGEEWVRRKVMQLWIKHGTRQAVAKATGIPALTINNIVAEKRKEIIKALRR